MELLSLKSEDIYGLIRISDLVDVVANGKETKLEVGYRYDFLYDNQSYLLEVDMIDEMKYTYTLFKDGDDVCEVLVQVSSDKDKHFGEMITFINELDKLNCTEIL